MTQQEEWKVSIRYQSQYGYVGYEPISHKIDVHFADAGKRDEVANYLNQEQVIPISTGNIEEFRHDKLFANAGIAEFKAVLTCLSQATGVQVDWSRPVE